MSTLITEMEDEAGRKLLLFMGWKCCVTPQCGYEVFIQWHRTLLEGKSLSVTEGQSGTSRPDPEKDTVSLCWHPSPENPGKLLPGFGHAHRHANSWPWSPVGTCVSGLGRVWWWQSAVTQPWFDSWLTVKPGKQVFCLFFEGSTKLAFLGNTSHIGVWLQQRMRCWLLLGLSSSPCALHATILKLSIEIVTYLCPWLGLVQSDLLGIQ